MTFILFTKIAFSGYTLKRLFCFAFVLCCIFSYFVSIRVEDIDVLDNNELTVKIFVATKKCLEVDSKAATYTAAETCKRSKHSTSKGISCRSKI